MEIRWNKGKDEYTREEVGYMLESQRAIIYNDINNLIQEHCRGRGETAKLTMEEKEVLNFIKNAREVQF